MPRASPRPGTPGDPARPARARLLDRGGRGTRPPPGTQFADLLPLRERVLGPEHPDTLIARANLARFTGQAGILAAARDQYADLLPVEERVLGPEHPDTAITRGNLAHWTAEADDDPGTA